MAYADTIRTATCDMEDVADLIDGLVVDQGSVSSTGLNSTASTSNTDLTTTGVTVTTAADDIVLVLAYSGVSVGNTTDRATLTIAQDGTGSSVEALYRNSTSATDGQRNTAHMSAIYTPSAGSHTYKIVWRVVGGGGGTIYSANHRLIVLVFQG